MSTPFKKSILTVLIVFSASLAFAGRNVGQSRFQALASVGCVDGNCEVAGSSVRLPTQSGFRALAKYAYNQDQRLKLQRMTLIDESGRGRDLRRSPEENKWDPKLFSPIGTVRPNQDIIDPDLRRQKDERTPTWIRKNEATVVSKTFMVSPCHALTSYHSVFGGDVWPDVADYSATITLKNANTGEPFELKAKPVAIGAFNLFEPRKRDDWVLLRTENCPIMSSGVGWFGLEAIKEDQKDLPVNIAAFYERKCGSKFWTKVIVC